MGEPILVGQGQLCLANWREVADPPLRMIQTWSATLRAWEDLRFLGTWNAAANCFDGQKAWQTATSTVTPMSHAHVRCVATTCATKDFRGVCELRGMRSACIEEEPALIHALGAQSGIAYAMQRIQSSSLEAMDSATNRINFWRQLQRDSLPDSERAMLTSKTEVWYLHHQAAVIAWNLSSSVLQQHVVEQARSVLGRLPILSGLLDEAFNPPWSDRHTITDLTQNVLEAIENRVADYSLTYSEIMTVMGYGRVTMQQLHLDESNLHLTTQSHLAQLQLEIAAQLVSMGLQMCSLAVTEQLHMVSNGTEVQVLTVADIASNWQQKAAQLLALWKQVLDERFSGINGAEAPNAALQCLGRKAAEARRLITSFEEGSQWTTSDGETGFAACRDFHAGAPRIDVAVDVQTSASDAADAELGLVGVRAKTENGDRQLCYLPSAGSVTEPVLRIDRLFAGNDAAVELHMPDTFEDWSAGGRRLAQHAASIFHLCADGTFCAGPQVPQMYHLDAAPETHGRVLDQSCNSGTTACGPDLWCNVATWQLEDVGHGYYSPDEDCSRSSCTSMESEIYGMDFGVDTGSASYTASGGGTDQCPWGCGGGDYAQVMNPFGTYICVEVGVGEWSPPGSKLIFQW